jgi:hypothetical protein
MFTQVEKNMLEDLAADAEHASEIRRVSRRKIFKLLRKELDCLKDSHRWAYSKISRGYSTDIKDSQLIELCRSLVRGR